MDEFERGQALGRIEMQLETLIESHKALPCQDHDARIKELSAPKKISLDTLKAIPHIGKIITLLAGAASTAYAALNW
jgi:hypothetical protein